MINMVQNAKDQAAALAMAAYQAAVADGTLPQAEVKTAPVEIPKDTANGDFTTTFALAASKALRQPPRNIAQALLDHMDLAGSYFASAEIAGPGFLNFRLNDSWYAAVCEAVESEGAGYGTADHLKGQKIMVEFVSANPTGPMHMGNARGVSTVTGVALIPVLFYTYTGVLGRHLLWADIAVFYLSVLGAFALDFRLLRRGRFTSLWQQILGLLALWGLAFLFVYCTFHPPELGLWQDPVTLGYGLPK